MSKSIVLLLLCYLEAVYAVEPKNLAPEASGGDLPSVELLAEIKRDEVLPLIIFLNPNEYPYGYRLPENLTKYRLTDGKISNGTKFEPKLPGEQTFLCPLDENNSKEKCLVRKKFEESEPLRCASEQVPEPELINMHYKCSGTGDTTMFTLVYWICERKEHQYYPDAVTFYQICYDKKLHKTLYTHHEIMSPGLLNLNLLARERSADYADVIVISDDPILSRHSVSKDDLIKEATGSYKLQQVIPAEEMAFATWRRTTFINVNYEWQHKELVDLWDKISTHLRSFFEKSEKQNVSVRTAIVDVPYQLPEGSEQFSNIWVKMVVFLDPSALSQYSNRATVILMNNFIDHRKSSDLIIPLKKYCDKNLCVKELTAEFNRINGAIRCCPLTSQILDIFYLDIEWEKNSELLHIPDVTHPGKFAPDSREMPQTNPQKI